MFFRHLPACSSFTARVLNQLPFLPAFSRAIFFKADLNIFPKTVEISLYPERILYVNRTMFSRPRLFPLFQSSLSSGPFFHSCVTSFIWRSCLPGFGFHSLDSAFSFSMLLVRMSGGAYFTLGMIQILLKDRYC